MRKTPNTSLCRHDFFLFFLVLLEHFLAVARKQCNFSELLVAVCYRSGIDFGIAVETLLVGCYSGGG